MVMPRSVYQPCARCRKRRAARAALVLQQLGVGEAGVVVDRDVQVAPAGAAIAIDAVLADPLSDLPETPEFLDIDVHKLAWALALVALPDDPVGARQARAARTTQHLSDR
jgi:hypothetical protein